MTPLPEWNDNSDYQPDMPSSAMKKLSPRNNSEGKILIIILIMTIILIKYKDWRKK